MNLDPLKRQLHKTLPLDRYICTMRVSFHIFDKLQLPIENLTYHIYQATINRILIFQRIR